MPNFHSLKIKEIRKNTPDCSVVTFEVPESLQLDFQFRQGQYLTLKRDIENQDIRRSYSLCSSPYDREWRVAIKKIPGGIFSTFANEELKSGDTLEVMTPSGSFGIDCDPEEARTYAFFAAGSGITPVLSMIKAHLHAEPNAACKLFYVNRTAKSIIFKEELEQLRNTYFGRLEIFYFLTQEQRDIHLFNGRFDEEKMEVVTQMFLDVEDTDAVFLCGPEKMVHFVSDYLVEKGLPKENVHYELFVTGLTKEDKARMERLAAQDIEGVEIIVVDGGKEFAFTMTKDFDNILDAAIDAGMDLPFACKGGVCSTCKCQVEKGTTEMMLNYCLEEDELKQNMVLSCQAVPTSDNVRVNFDV
ncbi:MAG: 2Fe-2S iron-sulfur cluster-binding protein [Flavobacteriales bacterium]|nr:2Fe-2S iron-sulfur cluster-binding protein [Flavobacteriales bacterium]